MICNLERSGRLYLSKGDQEVYIDNCKIPQHHIDGIRFLYRQYKKKKPGVIVNYQPEYGRNLQIVLFLKAVHSFFKKPVLVLCKEGAEHNWMEQFQMWTDFYDDVVIETQKPFIKKMILINTMSNLPVFSRREWSVVILDDEEFSQQVLKLPFKADYKIYNTSVNMKDNLDTFSQVYKWLYPEETKDKGKWKFDKKNFIVDSSNVKEVIDKAILLDAFMEDIVATNIAVDTCEKYLAVRHETDSPPITVSRKNKDATGTKIKRSKRIEHYEDDDIPVSKTKTDFIGFEKESTKVKSPKLSPNGTSNTTLIFSESSGENEDFSIDNFKKKINKKMKKDVMLRGVSVDEDIKMDTLENESHLNLYYEPDSGTDFNSDRFYEMDTLVFSDSICEEKGSNINEPEIGTANAVKDDVRENNVKDNEVSNKHDIETEKNNEISNITNNLPTVEIKLSKSKEIVFRSDEIISCHDKFELTKDSRFIDEIKHSDIELNTTYENSQSICNEINLDKNGDEISKNSPCDLNEVNHENEVETKEKSFEDIEETSNDIHARSKSSGRDTETKQNGLNEDIKTVTSNIDVPVVNLLKRDYFEDEMKDVEEKALKKFKGSILDNLF